MGLENGSKRFWKTRLVDTRSDYNRNPGEFFERYSHYVKNFERYKHYVTKRGNSRMMI